MMIMNVTNFTDPTSSVTELEGLVPGLVELDISGEEGGEPVYVGFIENSLLKVVPKFFKALVTLLISGLLLGVTLLCITLWKRGCRTHRKLEEDKPNNGKAGGHGAPFHSVIVTPPDEDDESSIDDSTIPSSSIQPIRLNMKVPKQALLRRASGPFGSEALSFVGEQYTMKTIEKERHHYIDGHNPHGRHSPQNQQHHHPHHSSAASTEDESGKPAKKTWFKKSSSSTTTNEP